MKIFGPYMVWRSALHILAQDTEFKASMAEGVFDNSNSRPRQLPMPNILFDYISIIPWKPWGRAFYCTSAEGC